MVKELYQKAKSGADECEQLLFYSYNLSSPPPPIYSRAIVTVLIFCFQLTGLVHSSWKQFMSDAWSPAVHVYSVWGGYLQLCLMWERAYQHEGCCRCVYSLNKLNLRQQFIEEQVRIEILERIVFLRVSFIRWAFGYCIYLCYIGVSSMQTFLCTSPRPHYFAYFLFPSFYSFEYPAMNSLWCDPGR